MSDSKWEKIGTIAYIILMVFYGVYTLVLSIQAYTKFSNSTEGYLNMVRNLEQNFIVDVQVSNTKCPQGYSTIFEWDWQGTKEGCDCTNASYEDHNEVSGGSCNSTEIYNGCFNIGEQPAVFFDAIEGATDSKQLVCVKRGNTKFSDAIADQKGSCSTSQKLCGNLLKQETIICVGESEPCPIYSIQQSSSKDSISYPSYEWNEIHLDSGDYLYVNINGQSSEGFPLSETRFTQVGVCKLENTKKTIPNKESDYVLMKTERNGCSESDDTFTRTNLEIAENKYYSINIPQSQWNQMKNWNNFEVPESDVPFESFSRPFISWKIEQRSLVKGFVDAQESIKSVKKAQLAVFIINIIVCILVSIILSIFQVYNLAGKDVPCIPGKGVSELRRIVLIKQVLTYGSKVLQIPFLLWAFSLSVKKKDELNQVANSQPSDARFNGDMAVFADQLENDVYKKNLIALIVLAITLLIDIILLVKTCCIKQAQKADKEDSHKGQNENVYQEEQQQAKPQNVEYLNTHQPLNTHQQDAELGYMNQQQSFQPQLSPYPHYPPPTIEQQQQPQPIVYIDQQPQQIGQMIPPQQYNIGVQYAQPQYPMQPYLPNQGQQGGYGYQQGYGQPGAIQQHQQIIQQPYVFAQGENQPFNYQKQEHS